MDNIKEIALEKLSLPYTESSFFNLIRWVDEECCADENQHGIAHQIATRAIIAVGHYMIENENLNSEPRQNIIRTIKSASEYALFPDEPNSDKYFFDATNSYPFGAGDGCFSVRKPEFDDGCKPGSGCQSALGGIVDLFENIITYNVIVDELVPWLKGISDPILERIDVTNNG